MARTATVTARSGPSVRATKTFLLVEKCLERVYCRGAVLAAGGSNPEMST